jgi:TP901 family phage tail tape measure protein
MANEKIGTGYYEIYADLTKIKAQLAEFTRLMQSKDMRIGIASVNSELTKTSAKLKTVGNSATQSFNEALRSALSLERIINRLAFIGTVGAVFTLGAAFKSAIGGGIKAAEELQLQMSHVFTVMDEGKDTLAQFKESVKEISVEFVQKMKEVSFSLYDIISARIGEDNALEVLAASAKLATANMAEMRDVTNTLIAILNSYKITGTKVVEVTDMLQKTIKVGKMEMSDFASTLGKVIPQAAAYNIKLEQMFGVLATMTNQGMKAREAVTSINRALTAWSQNSELASILQKDGIRGVVDALSLMDIQQQKTLSGGVRGVKALNAFMNDYATTLQNTVEIIDNAGSSNEAYLKQSDSLAFKINQKVEKNALLWQNVGEELLPLKSLLLDLLITVSDFLATLITIPKLIGDISGKMYLWISGYKEIKESNEFIIAYERKMIELAAEKNRMIENGAMLAEDEFTKKRVLAKQYNDILNSANGELNILKKKRGVEVAYGREVIDIDNKILEAYEKKLHALNRLIDLGNEYSTVLDDVYDTQIEIAKLSTDEFLKTDFGKFKNELQIFSESIDASIISVRGFFEGLVSGAIVNLGSITYSLSDYLIDNEGLAEKIKTSRDEFDKLYDYLLSKNEVLAKWFKSSMIRPPRIDLTEFDKYMESLSGAFEKNNKVAEFVKYMQELDELLGNTYNESLIRFMNGEGISEEGQKKLDDLKISAADLDAKLKELSLTSQLFFKVYSNPENIENIISWAKTVDGIIEDLSESFGDFVANETSEWARMLMEGENATKSFYDFFDRLMSQMLSNFTAMITKMIIQWALFKALGIGENPFSGMFGSGGNGGWRPPMAPLGNISEIRMPNISLPSSLANSINRTPEVINQNNITLYPTFNARFDRRSAGWVVDRGNKYNTMGNL